jgi:hypothetical protein
MKLKLDLEKYKEFIAGKLKYLPLLAVSVLVIIFSILTYLVLAPRVDRGMVSASEASLQSLDIRFNTKLLNELGTTKNPAQLGTIGGRDPFSGF